MLQKNIRFSIILLCLILGIVLHWQQGLGSAFYLYVTALLLLATHFLFGNVWAAFSLLKKGQVHEAERMMDQIKRPDFLWKGHRAYYHFIKGFAALYNKEFPIAEQHLNTALALGLRTTNDTALVTMNLAHLCFVQGKKAEAKNYLERVKALPYNDLMLKEKVLEIEGVLQG
jgi:hypothetical protein